MQQFNNTASKRNTVLFIVLFSATVIVLVVLQLTHTINIPKY